MDMVNVKNVFKRPKPNESEDDLIEFQNLFLSEKAKNTDFQPAAKVVRLTKPTNEEPSKSTKLSQFAKKRGLQKEEILTQSKNPDKLLLGNVVEKTHDSHSNFDRTSGRNEAFPKACRIDRSKLSDCNESKSLFARSICKNLKISNGDVATKKVNSNSFANESCMVKTADAESIHKENIQLLNGMDEAEILAERQKLMASLDPGLLRFIQSKRKATNVAKPEIVDSSKKMETDLSSIELLSHPDIHNWPHFDVVESEKLEWMKDVANSVPQLKPGESYEARFDWKGVLLPYFTPETDSDRQLFLHEAEAQRPGYTLQELFRLARSNVTQQRNTAIGAISGILNIYNQGFYDKVLEVPISKIFFLLRYTFDENSPILIETSSRALATLFYNDSDEILLDCVYECAARNREPTLAIVSSQKTDTSLTDDFAKMTVSDTQTFHSVLDAEEDTSTLNDFHLAEVNLIECLLRTNILQRINYVMFAVRSDNSTVISCFKILIRLARTDKKTAEQLFHRSGLLENCVREFLPHAGSKLPTTHFYQRPQFLFLKLLRIIAAYELPVWQLNIEEVLKSYIHMKSDLSIEFIKLQTESFRLAKTICLLRRTNELYGELMPAMQYLLEWHYNFVQFDRVGGHSIIRQHASALIALIGCKPFTCGIKEFTDKLNQCISKWFYIATRQNLQDFSQIILLSTSLVTLSRLQGCDHTAFVKQYLIPFLNSQCFTQLCNDLCETSLLLASTSPRSNKKNFLPDLDSVQFTKDSPTLIISEKYPVYIFNGILSLLHRLATRKDENAFNDLMASSMNAVLFDYLKRLSNGFNENVRKNWFVRNELSFLVNLLRFENIMKVLDKTTVQKIAFNVIRCCTANELEDLLFILKNVVFNLATYDNVSDVFQTDLDLWYKSYLLLLGPVTQQTNSLVHVTKNDFLVPNDWFWQPLLIFLNSDKRTDGNQLTKHKFIASLKEKDVIQMTLKFTKLQQRNSLNFITATEELMFLMISFMGPDCTFLEPDVNELLAHCIKDFFKQHKDTTFNFDDKFEGKSDFENLYVLFLDHFQGTSYGNESFSSLLMVPLAQKYDSKWRKMVWSEHATALRFVNCGEDQCLGSLHSYLYPIEKDKSLLKSYYQAMNGVLRQNSIAYKIAKHHLEQNQII
ncbi:RNA polymerase II-associated protein 1 [Pseudolycoriella hygida]|uniref:RNA polymerase II-associated protein 1 n=1 Tax=Pseudolycoriella hygida TaxID=35572 RepID=A0A9Q0MPK5_9DIPT|nr:RNA polymerase II-associated protein 1 [Pseudolycoriella hygida]